MRPVLSLSGSIGCPISGEIPCIDEYGFLKGRLFIKTVKAIVLDEGEESLEAF
jgi:hypothetical protein